MAENVTVAVRVRPPNEKEQQTGDECIWAIDPVQQNTISVSPAALCDFVEQGNLSSASNIKFNFSTSAPRITLPR